MRVDSNMGLAGSKTIIPIKEADAKLGASLRIEMDKVWSIWYSASAVSLH